MTSASSISTDTQMLVVDSKRPVIMVCLQNKADRDLIRQYLSDRYRIVISEFRFDEKLDFDLCIIDKPMYRQYKEDIVKYKDFNAPVFIPFLLLEKNQHWSQQSDQTMNMVDDVVPIPVSPRNLRSRIETLLQTHEYSLMLKIKNEKLQEEKEKYRLITENASDMVIRNKPDGTFTYVSHASEKLTGYTPQELIGRNIYEFYHSDDLDELAKVRDSFMNDPDIQKVAYRFRTKRNGYTWMESSVRSIRDPESGEVVEIQGAVRDISDRKEYEQKLQEEKERYRLITENSNDMISLHAPDATYRYVSPSSERLTGFRPEELIGKSPFEYMHPEDREALLEDESDPFDGKEEVGLTFRKQTKRGDYIWVETRMKPIRDEETGEIIEIQASTRDVSERIEYEQELMAEKEFNDTVIASMPSLFYVIDEDMNLIRWNKKMEEKLGYSGEELAVMSPLDMYPEKDRPMVMSKIQEVLETGDAEMEADIIPKEGPIQHHFINGRKFTKEGKTFIVGTGIDLTEQYKTLHDLQERIKEQTCLYNIAKLNGRPETVKELLEEAVKYLPAGWQYPEITEAVIEYDGKRYATERYRETDWSLIHDRKKVEGKSLAVKVVYLEERSSLDEGPFLNEERKLLDAIADTLASQIQRISSQNSLKESEKRWEQLVQKNPGLVQISIGEKIEFVNPAGAQLYGMENPEDLIGKLWRDFISFENSELVEERVRRAAKGENLPLVVHKVTTWDGRERYIELQSVGIQYHDEKALLTVGQDVTERIEYEQQLKKSLDEKQVLLQEVHHRVKNNLAVVSGLLQIQRFNSDNEEINKVLTNSEMRIKSMALIHEKLYRSDSLSDIDFKDYIENLAANIEKTVDTPKNITLSFNCESIPINVNQAVPCALIINELLSNSYEHAFVDRKEGQIRISMEEKDGRVRVTVQDDGVGVPNGLLEREHFSMGYTIINTLILQLNAELDIRNDEGTAISFSFQKKALRGSSSTLVE